jgi:hypothetical protein
MTIDSFNLTGDSWTGNWSGNETLSVGIIDPESTYRGGLSITAGIFLSSALKSLQGSVDWALYWNDVGSIVPQVKLSATDFDGTHFSVTVRNLVKGATYRLLRDTTLPLRVGKVEVDATVAGDTPVTLSDSDLPESRNKAFYQVEEIR